MSPCSDDSPLLSTPWPWVHYDVYLAHSREARWLAEELDVGLRSLDSLLPTRRPTPLRIFLDQTCMPATAQLGPDMRAAVKESDWFVYLASPQSARSEWVGQEISWWLEDNKPDRILIVLVDGDWRWDPTDRGFDLARSSAINPALGQVFAHQPRVVDLRWAVTRKRWFLSSLASKLSRDKRSRYVYLLQHNRLFLSALADLAAPLCSLPKEDILREVERRLWISS